MKIPFYHIDAFTDRRFAGNPAAVCFLSEWLADNQLEAIAKENNLPATVFLVRIKEGFAVRWITPEYELPLCGHGSLAAGWVIFNILKLDSSIVSLQSRWETLFVSQVDDGIILDLPQKELEKMRVPSSLEKSLGGAPMAFYAHKHERCLVIFEKEEQIKAIVPDMQRLKELDFVGITVTAPGTEVDFVSRTFYPAKTISEDPATGASHCLLAPYWGKRLGKTKLTAKQLSLRGGDMTCEWKNNRVLIRGKAVLFSEGVIFL